MSGAILIVEDDRNSRDLFEYLLRGAGHFVVTAVNGADGLRAAKESVFDLVLCDLQMPVRDGYDFLKEIRAVPAFADVPVIAITAFSMLGARERVLAAGFSGYFSKPVEPETFLADIERFLPVHMRSSLGGSV
ncbi:MAG: response regulator [Proteobacteria bacterium]|nr:response regulator [Pseudomonadota bacterium]